jgi:hypothetical protein
LVARKDDQLKIVFEVLDRGCLVTAEDKGVTERLAYETADDALDAVASALGIEIAGARTPSPQPVAPAAPMPEPDQILEQPEAPPPSTRRIGLMQPRKSAPPAGRRPGGV